ncbi:MAG TPA: methyltransferase domain-containing protein, partial [Thermomicrobiales bacterium]|nr:methyltransferase domain-containing protein [Thermomicrobiales bacterium]
MAERAGRRADYGLDAPGIVGGFAAAGALGLAGAAATWHYLLPRRPLLAALVGGGCGLASATGLGTAAAMVLSSKSGKYRVRDRLLDDLALRGDETLLDVGCGRGLLLLGAARRLPRGRAVGLDVWRREDQSGNSRETTLANARAEGVADRVAVEDGDARAMPFPDATFDVVVSSLALHNIRDAEGRARALGEVARVLRPGGRVALVDFQHTVEYAAALAAASFR